MLTKIDLEQIGQVVETKLAQSAEIKALQRDVGSLQQSVGSLHLWAENFEHDMRGGIGDLNSKLEDATNLTERVNKLEIDLGVLQKFKS